MDLDRARTLLGKLHIRDKRSSRMVPFRFNPNQDKLFAAMKKQYEQDRWIRMILLKSRRVGMSSLTDAMFFCHCQAYSNLNAQIVAHLAKSSQALFRVPRDLASEFPYFNQEDVQEKRIFFRHRGGKSILDVATAGTPSAGRGETLAALHLSECAFYPGEASFTSMLPAVSQGHNTMVILESTANGREGPGEAFANFWDGAVNNENEFVPLFLSWLDDPECVADEQEAEDAPRDDLEKELMTDFKATRAQIAWMRRTKATQCRNLEQLWLQEFPHCASVAFQVSGDPAFPREELAYAESTVKEPVAIGMLLRYGKGFEFKAEKRGMLHVWELPVKGQTYFIGADAALGTEEGDFAAYTVYNGTTGDIAARFADRIHPEALADQCDMAGRWYGNAMVNIELTGNLGRWAQKLLRDVHQYPNIYRWKGKDDRAKGGKHPHRSNMLGFETTQATRRLLFDSFRFALRSGMEHLAGGLRISDRMLVNQMSLATIKDWSFDVRKGHDDVLFSAMIAVLTAQQYPPPRFALRNKKPEQDVVTELANLSPRVSATRELWEASQLRYDLAKHWKKVRAGSGRDRLAGI